MGDELIRGYLSELDAALTAGPGPVRARAAIVTEIGDGLADAVADLLDQGCPPTQATRRAVDDFGPATVLAAEFVPILAAAQVRRCALVLLRTGPVVGAMWLATALLATPLAPPVAIAAGIMVAAALLAAVPCSMFAILVTGHGTRWWSVPPHRAVAAARIATGGAIVGDLVLLIALATQAPAVLTAPSATALGGVLGGLATLASLLRLVLTVRGAVRLRRTRVVLAAAQCRSALPWVAVR